MVYRPIPLGRRRRNGALLLSPGLILAFLALIAPPAEASSVEYTYSVNSKGVIASPMAEFADVVAATLADPRGWSLGGSIRFRRVDTGGSFRLWLTANALVPSFGGPCTTFYSCQPGRDIVINEDRWRTGSPYWPGPVAEYRHMVLNHEIGHWLGLNHVSCPAAGTPAPIMMQQSKGVGTCRANPWPLPSERSRVAAARAVPVLTTPPVPVATGIAAWPTGGGYRVAWSDGRVTAAGGSVLRAPGGSPDATVVGVAAATGDAGWIVAADGDVIPLGGAPFVGSMGGRPLVAPVVGMAASPSGRGYWLVAADGGVFTFGDAPFVGSMGGHRLVAPVVGMAASPSGRGYWLVAADGGVFTFGDAAFFGSMGGRRLVAPVVGMAPSGAGRGYRLVASDGGVFAFGNAPFAGSLGGQRLDAPVAGMAAAGAGGYWLVTAAGAVSAFGAVGGIG